MEQASYILTILKFISFMYKANISPTNNVIMKL